MEMPRSPARRTVRVSPACGTPVKSSPARSGRVPTTRFQAAPWTIGGAVTLPSCRVRVEKWVALFLLALFALPSSGAIVAPDAKASTCEAESARRTATLNGVASVVMIVRLPTPALPDTWALLCRLVPATARITAKEAPPTRVNLNSVSLGSSIPLT